MSKIRAEHPADRGKAHLRLDLNIPSGPGVYQGGGSLEGAQALPLWLAGRVPGDDVVGVQLDLTIRNKSRGSSVRTLYLDRSTALNLAQAILLAIPRW